MKKLIFDFDGTLVDSMPVWADFILKKLDELGVCYPDDIIKIVSPLGTGGAAEYLIQLGVDSTVDELLSMMDDFALTEYTYNIPAKEGVTDSLRRFKSEGYSLNILTACNHNLIDPCLKRLELFDLFDNIWSCEEDLGMNKKNPEIYVAVSEMLGDVCENCVLFDDNIGALTCAYGVGMKTVGVFDETSSDIVDEMMAVSHKYIYSFEEL